jgi:hypothetical protein
MARVMNVGRLALVTIMGLVVMSAMAAPALLAQGPTQIEGTVTGMNTTEDPPILTVTTDAGASYTLRAPDHSSVAAAQLGSRFRATGSVVGNTFIAGSVQLSDAGDPLPALPLVGGQSGVIDGADTASNPPRLLVSTGSGQRLLILPGQDRIGDIQLGATISFTGSPQADAFLVSEWVLLSDEVPAGGPSGENENSNDNS